MVLEEVGPGAGPDSLLEEEWGVFALMDEEFVASIFESRLHDDDFRDENLFELDDASSHEPIDGGEIEETRIDASATTCVDGYGPCGHPLTAMELHGAYNHRPIRQILRTTGRGVLGLRLQTGVDHGGAILSSREINMAHLQAIEGCRVCIAGKTNARPQKALRERRAAIELQRAQDAQRAGSGSAFGQDGMEATETASTGHVATLRQMASARAKSWMLVPGGVRPRTDVKIEQVFVTADACRPKYSVEVCAGTHPVGLAAQSEESHFTAAYDNDAAVLEVAAEMLKGERAEHATLVCVDANTIDATDLERRMRKLWGVGLSQLYSFHVSIPCQSYSGAMGAENKHRHSEGTPRTEMGRAADVLLQRMVALALAIQRANPQVLITFENPFSENGLFLGSAPVRDLLGRAGWVQWNFDYCMNTDLYLPGGEVNEDSVDARVHPGGFPRKRSTFVGYGLPADVGRCFPRCQFSCPFVFEDPSAFEGRRHRNLICTGGDRSKPGQRLVTGARRSAIPAGVFVKLHRLHDQWVLSRMMQSGEPTGQEASIMKLSVGSAAAALRRSAVTEFLEYHAAHRRMRNGWEPSEAWASRNWGCRSDRVMVAGDEESDGESEQLEGSEDLSSGSSADDDECSLPDLVEPSDDVRTDAAEFDDEFTVDDLPDDVRVPSKEAVPTSAPRPRMVAEWLGPAAASLSGTGEHRYRMVETRGQLVGWDIVYPENKRLRGGVKELVFAVDYCSTRAYLRYNRSRSDLALSIKSIVLEAGWRTQGWSCTCTSDTDSSLSKTLESVCTEMGLKYEYAVADVARANFVENFVGPMRDSVRCAILAVPAGVCGMEPERLEWLVWSTCTFNHNRIAKMSDPMGRTPMEIDTGVAPVFGCVEPFKVAWIRCPTQVRKARGRSEPLIAHGPPAKAELASFLAPVNALGDGSYALFMTARQSVRRTRDWRIDPTQPLGFVRQIGTFVPGLIGGACEPAPGGGKSAKCGPAKSAKPVESKVQKKAHAIQKATDEMSKVISKAQLLVEGEKKPKLRYIADRVEFIIKHNYSVYDALYGGYKYNKPQPGYSEALRPYLVSDLRYDLDNGYLKVQHPDESSASGTEVAYMIRECERAGVEQWMDESDDEGDPHGLYFIAQRDCDGDLPVREYSVMVLEETLNKDVGMYPLRQIYGVGGEPPENDHLDEIDDLKLYMASQAPLKDLPWSKYVGGEFGPEVRAACAKELKGLQAPQPDTEGNPGLPCMRLLDELKEPEAYAVAVATATKMRMLLDRKRDGTWKGRAVIAGHLENRVELDGVDFLYAANVARMSTVRSVILSPNRGDRVFSVRDITTAFLQSDPFPASDEPRYLKLWHPIEKKWLYFRQYRSCYGSGSAPVLWEATLAAFLEAPEGDVIDSKTGMTSGGCGFKRGKNERSAYFHVGRNFCLLCYVDDLGRLATLVNTVWFDLKLERRFNCKDAIYLAPKIRPLDFLGLTVAEINDYYILSMEQYITTTYEVLFPGVKLGSVCSRFKDINRPMVRLVDEESAPIAIGSHTYVRFRKCLGCCGWVCIVLRYDCCVAFSRIAQYANKPNVSALQCVEHLFHHLMYTRCFSLRQHKNSPGHVIHMCDSDLAGNRSYINQCRSQMSHCSEVDRALVNWSSKSNPTTSTVAGTFEFRPATAHRMLHLAHADVSSASAELYAASNAFNDAIALTNVWEECGLPTEFPIRMWIDNAACVSFIINRGLVKSKLRHIDCRLSWVQTLHDASVAMPIKVPTRYNYSDIGTKLLDFARHAWLRSRWYHWYPLLCNAELTYDDPIEDDQHVDTVEEMESIVEQHVKLIQSLEDAHRSQISRSVAKVRPGLPLGRRGTRNQCPH